MPASSHRRQRNNAHARRSHHAPRTPGGPSRLDSSHAPGRPISPPCRRRPDHRSARTPPGASRLVPRTLGAGLPVPDADRRQAAEERTSRRANAATRSRSPREAPGRKSSALPHTRQRTPPLAVKCAELPQLPQLSTGRRNPIPQHPRSAANLIARRCGASPPDPSRKCSRWGKPGFRRPASTGTPGPRVRAAQTPHVDEGESRANLARAAPLQDGRQTAAARRKRFIRFAPSRIHHGVRADPCAPHQRPTAPGRKSYESCNEDPLPEPTPPAADRS